MSKNQGLPAYNLINGALGQGPSMNTRQNIITGPGPKQYWNHSPGLERADYSEEGPFPIMGNIGALITQESSNYSNCSNNISVSSGPNCSSAFIPDIYTENNTCGENCEMSAPEAFGGKSFGMINGNYANPPHGLHAYKNIRSAAEGQDSNGYGCYESIPNLKKTGNTCELDYKFEANTVGDFTRLDSWKKFINQ